LKLVSVSLVGFAPLSFSRPYEVPKKERESHDDYEKRTFWERLHRSNGEVVVPAVSIKIALDLAAKHLGMKKSGRTTFRATFESGITTLSGAKAVFSTGIKTDGSDPRLTYERLYMSADGLKNGSKRVWRYYPEIMPWEATGQLLIVDDAITDHVFEVHLRHCGMFVGLGRWRPAQGGAKGRFGVQSLTFASIDPKAAVTIFSQKPVSAAAAAPAAE
jgi:hypothetical protein